MDETKARALADKLTAAVEFDVHIRDDIEPRVEIVGAEEMILAFAAEVRRDERERVARIVDEAAGGDGSLWYPHDDHFPVSGADVLDRLPAAIRALSPQAGPSYQDRVGKWLQVCFGAEIAADRTERNHRFLEEALELVQSGGCSASEAHQLVDYVFGRPVGEMGQEVGGVMNTLAALCLAYGRNMDDDAETELRRVWTMVEKIRAKQVAKPKHSPLPEITPQAGPDPTVALARLFADWWKHQELALTRFTGIPISFDTICKSGLFTSAGGWQLTDLGKAALKRAEGS